MPIIYTHSYQFIYSINSHVVAAITKYLPSVFKNYVAMTIITNTEGYSQPLSGFNFTHNYVVGYSSINLSPLLLFFDYYLLILIIINDIFLVMWRPDQACFDHIGSFISLHCSELLMLLVLIWLPFLFWPPLQIDKTLNQFTLLIVNIWLKWN